MDDQLKGFILRKRQEGMGDAMIKEVLVSVGWKDDEVIETFVEIDEVPRPGGVAHSAVKRGLGMWDAFQNILLFISLYVLATSVGLLLKTFVDRWVPGLQGRYYYSGSDGMRGYVAAIIVSLPMFSFFFLRVNKRTLEMPVLRSLRARKFLIYLTLVVTFIILLASVVTTVYRFLDGNVGLNFVLHVLVVVGISGLIFWYYLREVRKDEH